MRLAFPGTGLRGIPDEGGIVGVARGLGPGWAPMRGFGPRASPTLPLRGR